MLNAGFGVAEGVLQRGAKAANRRAAAKDSGEGYQVEEERVVGVLFMLAASVIIDPCYDQHGIMDSSTYV